MYSTPFRCTHTYHHVAFELGVGDEAVVALLLEALCAALQHGVLVLDALQLLLEVCDRLHLLGDLSLDVLIGVAGSTSTVM